MAVNTIVTLLRNTTMDAFADYYDTGTADTGADLSGYTSAYGTLLFECEMSAAAWGAAATGVVTAAAITDDSSANATGTAAVGRSFDQDNDALHDWTISTSGADLNLNTVSITSGDTVSITSATLTFPAS